MGSVNNEEFNIRVAMIGRVSVGKSTIMNAILRGHYSPTSVRRETATATEFRVHPMCTQPATTRTTGKRKADELEGLGGHLLDERESAKIYEIHKDRQEANACYREKQDLQNLDETLFVQDLYIKGFDKMRADTTISFIDIPSINDSGLGNLSKDWLQRNWSRLDCAIVVLDAQEGFNTSEPMTLIEDIHRWNSEDRKMPVIFLANKYDDNDNEQWSENIKEIEAKIEETFGVCGIQSKVEQFLNAKNSGKEKEFPLPAFLPCSAQYALIYLSALCEGFTIDHFKELPFEIVDSFGNSDVGNKKWRLLKTKEEKYNRAFKELEDEPSCTLGLKDTNFDKVISLIDHCVAGKEDQAKLISRQLDYEMQSKQQSIENVVENLRRIHNKKRIVLGCRSTDDALVKFFWDNYKRFENEAFGKLRGPGTCNELSRLMQLLVNYNQFVSEVKLYSEHCEVLAHMANLVRRQMKVIVENANAACVVPSSSGRHQRNGSMDCWENMSLRDWFNLIDSMIAVNLNKKAQEEFAADLRELRYVYHSVHDKSKTKGATASLTIPDSAEDSTHWGHLLQSYCVYHRKRHAAVRIEHSPCSCSST